MTRVSINPGACGFTAKVTVEKSGGKEYLLTIKSECPMVKKLGEALPVLNMLDIFVRLQDNPVYKQGGQCLKHTACPVPSGILKALEVEAGLNVPKDACIVFEKG